VLRDIRSFHLCRFLCCTSVIIAHCPYGNAQRSFFLKHSCQLLENSSAPNCLSDQLSRKPRSLDDQKDMFFSTVLSCNIVHKVRKNGTKIFLNPKAFYLRTLAALQYPLLVAMRGQYSMSIWTWQAIVLKYMYYFSPLHKRWPAGHNSLILCRLGSISPA
jgi:hypothetical protein